MSVFGEVKCGRCDRRYSSLRKRCPYCGARKHRAGKRAAASANAKWQLVAGILFLVAIIVAVIVLISMHLAEKENGDADTSPPGQTDNVSSSGSPDATDPSESPFGSEQPEDSNPTASETPPATMPIDSLTLNSGDLTFFYVGETFQLTATIVPAFSDPDIKWSSSNTAVATVDSTGLIKAVDRGTSTITAEISGLTAVCMIRVNADASDSNGNAGALGLELSHTDVTIKSETSESFTLKVTGATGSPTFKSSNTAVATVSASGVVTAVSAGNSTVTVTVDGVSMTCIVRVR